METLDLQSKINIINNINSRIDKTRILNIKSWIDRLIDKVSNITKVLELWSK